MSHQRVTIVGQGIAGSMLGWFCERSGISFRIVDSGHDQAASRVGAGLVSPLTGQRLVQTWKFPEWRNEALAIYRSLEDELGVNLVRELRIQRRFRDARQRELFLSRIDRPEVSPWIDRVETETLWLNGALQVDTGLLIARLRERWSQTGVLQASTRNADHAKAGESVIWCTGAASPVLGSIPWEPSRGEIVRGIIPGLDPDVVLNNGHWLLPQDDDRVLAGALFDRENLEAGVTAAGQQKLMAAAEQLAGRPMLEPKGDCGLRMNVRDRRPVVGWLEEDHQTGVFSGLAAKGALWAPMLARQWCEDGLAGSQIDPEVRADRFREEV